MANNATITVNDGASTPVAHAFDPVRVEGTKALYQNKSASAIIGRESLALDLKRDGKVVRTVGIDLKLPKLVSTTVNGVTSYAVDSFAQAKGTFLVPKSWTPAEAKNLRVLFMNICATSALTLMVEEEEGVW